MATSRLKRFLAASVAGSLMLSSTSGFAAPSQPQKQVDPWAVLAAMSGPASAVAVCGEASGVAVDAEAQLPGTGCVLPVIDAPAAVPTAGPAPLGGATQAVPQYNLFFAALPLMAAAVGMWFASRGHNHASIGAPNSAD